jgi:hypothetical protein
VATLYGEILCDLGILSKGEVQLRAASDFVGAALGESERKTNATLAAAKGCVLAIDEAYSLDPGRSADPYRKAVLDAIVEKVQPSGDADQVRGNTRYALVFPFHPTTIISGNPTIPVSCWGFGGKRKRTSRVVECASAKRVHTELTRATVCAFTPHRWCCSSGTRSHSRQ